MIDLNYKLKEGDILAGEATSNFFTCAVVLEDECTNSTLSPVVIIQDDFGTEGSEYTVQLLYLKKYFELVGNIHDLQKPQGVMSPIAQDVLNEQIKSKCNCDLRDLMMRGCSCGGV